MGFVVVNWLVKDQSIGPMDSHQEGASDLLLTNTIQLQYGTAYTLLNEADAEMQVYNAPEPSTLWLFALVVPLLASKYRRV